MFVAKITYFNVHKILDDYLGQLQNDVNAGAPTNDDNNNFGRINLKILFGTHLIGFSVQCAVFAWLIYYFTVYLWNKVLLL